MRADNFDLRAEMHDLEAGIESLRPRRLKIGLESQGQSARGVVEGEGDTKKKQEKEELSPNEKVYSSSMEKQVCSHYTQSLRSLMKSFTAARC